MLSGFRQSQPAVARRAPTCKDPMPIVSVKPTKNPPRPEGQREKKGPKRQRRGGGRGGVQVEGQKGLRCGEANPKQRLGGTSGQTPNADSQRQAYKRPTTHRHDVAEPRETVTASEVRKGEEGGGGEKEGRREGRKRKGGRGVAKEGDGEGGEEMGVCGKQTSLRAETEERKSEERRT